MTAQPSRSASRVCNSPESGAAPLSRNRSERDVVLVEQGRERKAEADRRRGVEHRDAVLRDERQHLPHVEAPHQHLRRSGGDGAQLEDGHAVDVEERQVHEHHVAAPDDALLARASEVLPHVGVEVGVGEHDALLQAGGAGGEGQRGDVVIGVERGLGRRAALRLDERPERGRRIRTFRDEDAVSHLFDAGEREVGGVRQRVMDDERLRAGRLQLVRDLAFAIAGVDGGDGRAGLEYAEEGDLELGAVRSEDADDVAPTEAHRRESGREPAGVRVQLREGEPAIAVHDGGLVRPSLGCLLEEVLHRFRVVRGER